MATYRDITKPWYGTARWKRRRAQQLASDPLCCMCAKHGIVKEANVADHVEPHKGDPVKFWTGALQSVCKPCHDGDKKRIENGGAPKPVIGADGWPE